MWVFCFLFPGKPVTFTKFISVKPVYALLLSCLAFTVSAQRNIDVLHYKYEIELSDKSDTVWGRAEITVNAIKETEVFYFDLVYGLKRAKGMLVEKAFVYSEEKKEWVKTGFSQDSEDFGYVDLGRKIKPAQ